MNKQKKKKSKTIDISKKKTQVELIYEKKWKLENSFSMKFAHFLQLLLSTCTWIG